MSMEFDHQIDKNDRFIVTNNKQLYRWLEYYQLQFIHIFYLSGLHKM